MKDPVQRIEIRRVTLNGMQFDFTTEQAEALATLSECELLSFHRALQASLSCVPPEMLSEIEGLVCDFFGLERAALHRKTRIQRITWPRQLVMYYAYRIGRLTLVEIGTFFAMDHGTVLYAAASVEEKLSVEAGLAQSLRVLSGQIAQAVQDIAPHLLKAQLTMLPSPNCAAK